MLNKTRYEINKKTKRPDLVYYQRKLMNYITLPNWFIMRYEKLLFPLLMVILVLVMGMIELNFGHPWEYAVKRVILWIFAIFLCITLITVIFWDSFTIRKAVVTEEEFKLMMPQLKFGDFLVWQWADSCFYDKRFHVVTQEEYLSIVQELEMNQKSWYKTESMG